MIVISYFLLFLFLISFSANLFSFVYGVIVPEHHYHERQENFLRKQTIYFSIHLSLVLLLVTFSVTCIGLPKEILIVILQYFMTCSSMFIGITLLVIIYGGFKIVSIQ